MDISNLDLNLLLVFEALLSEQNVTQAARRVGRSQSAMSAALARLRESLSDPLFVRTGRGVVPTPRALAIGETVRRVLADLRGAFEGNVDFDPAHSTRRFTVEMNEEIAIVLLPALLHTLRKAAPLVVVHVVPLEAREPSAALASGAVDLAVGFFKHVGAAYERAVLGRPKWVVIARRGHPVIRSGRRPTLADYIACAHLLVSPRGRTVGAVDKALRVQGKSRLVFATPFFAAAMLAVQTSDLILTTPVWTSDAFAPYTAHVTAPVPLELPAIEVSLLWHSRRGADRGLAWLRQTLQGALR